MYNKLIGEIKLNSCLKIKDKEYIVHSKTHYTTKSDANNYYVKIKLSDNKILLIIPDDNLICLGEVIENMKYEEIDENSIKFKNEIYKKVGSDYQLVKQIEFGNSTNTEGECEFIDYENINGNKTISLGVLKPSNERADVYADVIDIKDIKIIKE